MTKVYSIDQIKAVIDLKQDFHELIQSQQQAFIDFSTGHITVPVPIQMSFPKAHGDCHIKAGFKNDGDIFIVKIATGFYQNVTNGLPAGDGTVLVFSQETGLLQAILCDGGYLTTLRTALAAVVAAKITPWEVKNIGIIGTGQLAIQVLELMKLFYPQAAFRIWGRSNQKAKEIAEYYRIGQSDSVHDLMQWGGIVITTTASTKPIIDAKYVTGKTHIVALGADDLGKQECAPRLFQTADAVVVDSKEQAARFGDTFHAIQSGFINFEKSKELGNIIQKNSPLDFDLIITDLTGIAAQDIAIAQFVLSKLESI